MSYYFIGSIEFEATMVCCKANSTVVKDRGYAWVILAACVVINYLCIGFLFGVIGVLTSEYEVFFGVKIDEATWVGSILLAVLFLSGEFALQLLCML